VPQERLASVLDRLEQVRAAEAHTERLVRDGATMLDGVHRLLTQATIIE
jgi:hypothetical protein